MEECSSGEVKVKAEVKYPNGTAINYTMSIDSKLLTETGIGYAPYNATASSFNISIDCHDFTDNSTCRVNASKISGSCTNVTFDDALNGSQDLDLGVLLCVNETANSYNISFIKWGYDAGHEIGTKYCINSSFGVNNCSGWVLNSTATSYYASYSKTPYAGIFKYAFSDTSKNGYYNVTIYAKDTAGKTNGTEKINFLVNTPPWWSGIPPNQTIEEDTLTEIDLSSYILDNETASQNLFIDVISANASKVDCWADDVNGNFSIFPAENWYGTSNCSMLVNDGHKNSSNIVTIFVTVTSVNDLPKMGSIITNPTWPVMNSTFNCSINVTDIEGGISWVNFTMYYPNGSKAVDNKNGSKNGNIWSSLNVNPVNGTWSCNVTAFDGIDITIKSKTIPIDLDGDNYTMPLDCNDYNASVNPGVTEVLDNYVDDDCDGSYDEGGDYDNDTILNENDNCPHDYNPGQNDTNYDSIGDACNTTFAIISSSILNNSQLNDKIINDTSFRGIYDYADELGYTELINAAEVSYGSGVNATIAVLKSENDEVLIAVGLHQKYVDQNCSFNYCTFQNGSSCNSTGINANRTITKSFLIKISSSNNTILFFNQQNWILFNLSDGSFINQSITYNSCALFSCIGSCMWDVNRVLLTYFNPLCRNSISLATKTPTLPTVGFAAGACMVSWAAPCFAKCAGYLGPCFSSDNMCTPDEVLAKQCDGNTAIQQVCDYNGQSSHDVYVSCANGCQDGMCKTTCTPGLKCYGDNYGNSAKGYQNYDCSWSSISYCEYGCDNGACISPGSCPSYAPYSCNAQCWSCPTGFSLCCPSSGNPTQCCGAGSYCKSDGTCSNTCEFGWKCQDSTHLMYQYSSCNTISEVCTHGCIEDGNGVARCKETTCEAGWACQDSTHKGYQDSDCDWSQVSSCQYGCSNGACRELAGPKSSCTIEMESAAECNYLDSSDKSCGRWEFDDYDDAKIKGYSRVYWAAGKFNLEDCYGTMDKDDILSARLDFWIVDAGEDVRDTDLRVYKGHKDNDVNNPQENKNYLTNFDNKYNPSNIYPKIHEDISGTGGDKERVVNPCGGNDLSCGVDVTNTMYQHTAWDNEQKIVFAWYPEDDQGSWYLDYYPNDPKLYLEYPMSCSADSQCGVNGYVGSKYCSNNDVYRDYKTYSCTNQNCYYSTAPKKYEECYDTSYGAWSYSCSGTQLNESRTVYGRGCSSGACSYSTSTEIQTVQTCSYGGGYEGALYKSVCVNGTFACQDSCSDGIDNDGDGLVDTAESSCPSKVYVKNNLSVNVAAFEYNGNITLKGSCISTGACNPTANSFIIRNATNGAVAYINETGDMCISVGTCTGGSATCNPSIDAFIVQNSTGKNVSYIDRTGDLCLIGTLTQNGSP